MEIRSLRVNNIAGKSIIFLLLAAATFSTSDVRSHIETLVFFEDFDIKKTELRDKLSTIPLVSLENTFGTSNSNAALVFYQGNSMGSERIIANVDLADYSLIYKLEFHVKFCDNFDFVRGGKLLGLGPDEPVTGGNQITPSGWSARLMFRGNGELQTYVYHQEMKGKYGDAKVSEHIRLKNGIFYKISLLVQLNNPYTASNGKIIVSVDDKTVIQHDRIKFRGTNTKESLIRKILFHTFHGGNNKTYAPTNKDGSFKSVCANFDNIKVYKP